VIFRFPRIHDSPFGTARGHPASRKSISCGTVYRLREPFHCRCHVRRFMDANGAKLNQAHWRNVIMAAPRGCPRAAGAVLAVDALRHPPTGMVRVMIAPFDRSRGNSRAPLRLPGVGIIAGGCLMPSERDGSWDPVMCYRPSDKARHGFRPAGAGGGDTLVIFQEIFGFPRKSPIASPNNLFFAAVPIETRGYS